MHPRAIAIASLLALPIPAAAAAQTTSLTLDQAISLGLARHPALRVSEASVAVSLGEWAAARSWPALPSLFGGIGPAAGPDTTRARYQVGLSQVLELGGKRTWRSRTAEYQVSAARARLERSRAQVAWDVRRTFALALIARERARTAAEADSVGLALRLAAQDGLALGAGTQLEVNVATASHARDRRIRLEAERALTSALLEFREAVGAEATDSVAPSGTVMPILPVTLPADSLVSDALRRRPDLVAVRAEAGAADAAAGLARSFRWPDLDIGVSTGREEDLRVTQLSLSIPLPGWARNRGEVAAASANRDRARYTALLAARTVEFEVRDAYQALATSVASRDAFDSQVVERLAENLALADESFRAGKISLYAYNTIRRDLVEARLAYLDVLAESVERRVQLALAVGEPWE